MKLFQVASINIYEPDENLRSNMEEILGMEGHSTQSFSDFSTFLITTCDTYPDFAICSLTECDSSFPCHMKDQLRKFEHVPTITISSNPTCRCCEGKICLSIPFTREELLSNIE